MPRPENNITNLLKNAATATPERPALTVPDRLTHRTVTFSELWQQVDACSVGLQTAGLIAGDRVVLMVPMSIELYVLLLAVIKMGAVAIFVDPWVGMRQIASFAAFAEPTGFIGVPKSHLLRLFEKRLRTLPISVTTGRRFVRFPARYTLDELLLSRGKGEIAPVKSSDPALITFTSGSSGAPKGANRTHGFLLAQHAALENSFPYSSADIDMPMFPVFALNNLAQGISTIVPNMDFRAVEQVDSTSIIKQLEQFQVTTITASPPFFDRVAKELLDSNTQIPHIRRILSGGAPVSTTQLRNWTAAFSGAAVDIAYGSTEAEPVAHIPAKERIQLEADRPATAGYLVGQPIACIRCKVIRIIPGIASFPSNGWQELEVPHGEIGELVVTGAHVCKEYYKNAEATRANKIKDADGNIWHRMGDTGYFDDQGFFWLVGRVHSTIWRNGEAIHPQLIERAATVAEIGRVAAVGVPDTQKGERVVLAIEGECTEEQLLSLHRRLESAQVEVDTVLPVPFVFPLDPRHNAKIDYHELRNRITPLIDR